MRTTHRRREAAAGFSATDLIATLAIIALALALALPPAISTLRTYRRNLAALDLTTELRRVQSLAVARGHGFVLEWAPRGEGSAYRIVRDDDGRCSLPAGDAPQDDERVVRDWRRLDDRFAGIRIGGIEDAGGRSLDGIGFLPTGRADWPCGPASFPLRLQLVDTAGNVATIEIRRSGLTSRS